MYSHYSIPFSLSEQGSNKYINKLEMWYKEKDIKWNSFIDGTKKNRKTLAMGRHFFSHRQGL